MRVKEDGQLGWAAVPPPSDRCESRIGMRCLMALPRRRACSRRRDVRDFVRDDAMCASCGRQLWSRAGERQTWNVLRNPGQTIMLLILRVGHSLAYGKM
jgi:hypothetical protein